MRGLAGFVVLSLTIGACGFGDDDSDETTTTAAAEEEEGREETLGEDEVVTTTTLGSGPLEIATLLPIESGTFEEQHWIKWKLDAPIPDSVEQHVTYQLNIRSAEDDIFGVGWTIPLGEAPFASSFCLEDRPNCDDGIVPVGVELGSEGDELIFRIPVGTFGDATGLEIGAFIQTFATPNAEPVTEDVGDGARMPLETDDRDPC